MSNERERKPRTTMVALISLNKRNVWEVASPGPLSSAGGLPGGKSRKVQGWLRPNGLAIVGAETEPNLQQTWIGNPNKAINARICGADAGSSRCKPS